MKQSATLNDTDNNHKGDPIEKSLPKNDKLYCILIYRWIIIILPLKSIMILNKKNYNSKLFMKHMHL